MNLSNISDAAITHYVPRTKYCQIKTSPSLTHCFLQCTAKTSDLIVPQSKQDKNVQVLKKDSGKVQKSSPEAQNRHVAMNVVNPTHVLCRHTTKPSGRLFARTNDKSLQKFLILTTAMVATFAQNELYLLWHAS